MRLKFIIQQSLKLFSKYLPQNVSWSADMHKLYACCKEIEGNSSNEELISTSDFLKSIAEKSKVFSDSLNLKCDTQTAGNDNTAITSCIIDLLSSSENWSFRELNKILQNVLSDVLSTERLLFTSKHASILMSQISFMYFTLIVVS